MRTLAPWQSKRLHQLLNQTGKMNEKAELVKHYTKDRTTSSKEMYYYEVASLIAHLESYQNTFSKSAAAAPVPDAADKMRKKIIALAHEMKWELPGGKADMQRINNWCVNSGRFHQPLNAHSDVELAHLVTQFERVHISFLKAIAK